MRSNEEIIEIIDSRRIQKGLSLSELARRVGMAKSALSRYFNRTREFPINKVEDFAKALDISSEYILGFDKNYNFTSIETIYNQLEENRKSKVYSYAEKQLAEQNKIVQFPNQYDVDIYGNMTAGHGSMNFDKERPIKTVKLDYVPSDYDIAFEVSGDSMHPTFQNGEIIFVKKTNSIHDGMLAAVEINDEAFIKKLYIEENRLRLVSLNCEKDIHGNRLYPDFYADEKDDIHLIGCVLT